MQSVPCPAEGEGSGLWVPARLGRRHAVGHAGVIGPGGVPQCPSSGPRPGITEARSPDGEEFGLDRLVAFACRAATEQSPLPETTRPLVHAVLDHQHGTQ